MRRREGVAAIAGGRVETPTSDVHRIAADEHTPYVARCKFLSKVSQLQNYIV